MGLPDGFHLVAAFQPARIELHLRGLGGPTLAPGSQVCHRTGCFTGVTLRHQDKVLIESNQVQTLVLVPES
jgi:hypothetical protein